MTGGREDVKKVVHQIMLAVLELKTASAEMKAVIAKAGWDKDDLGSCFQNIADVYRDVKTIENINGQVALKRDRHRMAEAMRSKVASTQAMLAETHPLRDMITTEFDTTMMCQIVARLDVYLNTSSKVMNDSLQEAMVKLAKSIEEGSKLLEAVPDIQEKEIEFANFLKHGKKGMDQGVKLMKKVQELTAACQSIAEDLDGAIALKHDELRVTAESLTNGIQTIATFNALLAVLRNPQIRATEGAGFRVMLKDCMNQFDEEGSPLVGLCPAKLREEAEDILLAQASSSAKGSNRARKG